MKLYPAALNTQILFETHLRDVSGMRQASWGRPGLTDGIVGATLHLFGALIALVDRTYVYPLAVHRDGCWDHCYTDC